MTVLTTEQHRREGALILAASLDCGLVVLLLLGGIAGESLTCLAEGIRGGLMTLIDLVSLVVIRKIHGGALSGFDYGTGKIEQLCSIGIAFGLAAGAMWVGYDAFDMAMAGHSDATPLGLSLAAVVGALNLLVNFISWDAVRQATKGRPSAIMSAQLSARTTKLVASLLVQVTMTVAALGKDPVVVAIADAVGALMVCVVMAHAALRLMLEAVPDLLDRSIGEVAQPALERALTVLPASFRFSGFRSRGTRHAFALEVRLACREGTDVGEVALAERALAAELRRLLPDIELSVAVQLVPEGA
jgi:divalent metal cation (Fe/Co/Zn/Cd) transporter